MKTTSEGQEFRSVIKEERIRHGLTMKQVSEMTGVPYRSLQNWEAGVRKCPDYVTNMVVNAINQNFDNRIFLELLLETLYVDVETAIHIETKERLENVIKIIERRLKQ